MQQYKSPAQSRSRLNGLLPPRRDSSSSQLDSIGEEIASLTVDDEQKTQKEIQIQAQGTGVLADEASKICSTSTSSGVTLTEKTRNDVLRGTGLGVAFTGSGVLPRP